MIFSIEKILAPAKGSESGHLICVLLLMPHIPNLVSHLCTCMDPSDGYNSTCHVLSII